MRKQNSKPKMNDQKSRAVLLEQRKREFLEKLKSEGYVTASVWHYRRTTEYLIDLMLQQNLSTADLDEQKASELQLLLLDKIPRKARKYASFCMGRFHGFLIEIGDAPPRAAPVLDNAPRSRLKREYEDYLRDQRGLGNATIRLCINYFEHFMTFRFGDKFGNPNTITPDNIVAFLCKLREGPRPRRDRALPSHLRTLFNFLFWAGKTKRNLAISIPQVAAPKPTNIPRYLKPEEITQLVEAVRTDNARGRRNYAILLLMARLGLRAPETVAIQLEDIDWRAGTILIRGKGKLHDLMPLPTDVGEALVEYIRNGRRGKSRSLFVSSRAPYQAFKDGNIVNYVLHTAYNKTGLRPPQKYIGSHVLRHSLATDMLRKGASLDEIGDILRHRSRMTTTIYARHNVDELRSLARAWPVQGEVQ